LKCVMLKCVIGYLRFNKEIIKGYLNKFETNHIYNKGVET